MMLDVAGYDFSKETDLKARLWEKMSRVVTKQKTAREEISFDSLEDSRKPKTAAVKKNDSIAPPVRENRGKSK
ncbi:MAG: hypothetical protein LBC82_03930 [Oscillospiraceae bacterium]|jgi:hypothetical protein|nr:hypothetical protein [Oscillospiraceae bacterium]